MHKILTMLFLVIVSPSCFAFDPNDYREAPTTEAVFYAQAEFRSFRGFVQVLDPRDIAQGQYEKGFLVDAECSYLCHVVAEPKPLPPESAKQICASLFANSPEAKAQIMNGPMLGWFTAFVLYDKQRKPVAIVFQQLGVFFTSHVRDVGMGDMYQSIGDWEAYSYSKAFAKLVGVAKNYPPPTETPFLKWQNQKP